LAAFALGGLLQDSVTRSPRRRAAAWAVFALFFAIGAWTNVAGSARYLSRNYARRMVAYRAVAATPYRWVVVSHEAAALQLAALFEHKQFIYGPRSKDLRTIARGLAGRGDAGFLYVCDPYYGCGPFGGRPKKLTFFRPGSSEPIAMFSALGECDRYLLYDVRLAGA
jgi:hypothetical protein